MALQYQARDVVLSSDGKTAYLITSLGFGTGNLLIIDTATLAIKATLLSFSDNTANPFDLALSPDDTTLYVAMSGDAGQLTCGTNSICIFDTGTLALKGQVPKLTGYLAISRDGKSLYVTATGGYAGKARIVNTATLAISGIPTGHGILGRVTVDPHSHCALMFAESGTNTIVLIVNTLTNKIVGEFLAGMPGGTSPLSLSNFAQFAPDGESVWVLLSCQGLVFNPNCSTPNNAPAVLAGFSFPSGAPINQTPTAIPGDSLYLGFPQ